MPVISESAVYVSAASLRSTISLSVRSAPRHQGSVVWLRSRFPSHLFCGSSNGWQALCVRRLPRQPALVSVVPGQRCDCWSALVFRISLRPCSLSRDSCDNSDRCSVWLLPAEFDIVHTRPRPSEPPAFRRRTTPGRLECLWTFPGRWPEPAPVSWGPPAPVLPE